MAKHSHSRIEGAVHFAGTGHFEQRSRGQAETVKRTTATTYTHDLQRRRLNVFRIAATGAVARWTMALRLHHLAERRESLNFVLYVG